MTDANRKPWLTASEQIDHLKSRGVHFSLMSEEDARAYLEKNSNYFGSVRPELTSCPIIFL